MVGQTRSSAIAFWSAYFLLACALLSFIGPLIETRFFPVYTKFELIEATETPEGVIAVFEFTKIRQCGPKGSHWYLGNSMSIDVTVPSGLAGPEPRPLGLQRTSPYLLEGTTLADLKDPNRVMAEVRSQCNFPVLDYFGWFVPQPWSTVSNVYP